MTSANQFERSGEIWIVSYEGRTVHLRDAVGVRCIAELLRQPGVAVAAAELSRRCRRGETSSTPPPVELESRQVEQARVNVTRAIHAILRRLRAYHPVLAEHLVRTIRTGAHCSYVPDPRLPIEWSGDRRCEPERCR